MLKKLLAAVAIFTGAAISSNAQDYHFAGNPIDSTTTGGSVVMFNYVTNTSTSDFTIKWKIIYVDNPNNWTITGFCDNINCFGDTATLQGALHTSNTIPPNNTPTQGNLTLDVEVPVDGSTGHLQVKVR